MTFVQTLRGPEDVILEYFDLIAVTEPLQSKAFRKVLDPLGVRFR